MSTTHHARVMRLEVFVIAWTRQPWHLLLYLHKKITSIATWNAVIIQACVEHIFCFGVQTMESVLDDCLAQFSRKNVLKEEQHQAVLGLLGQKDVVAPLSARGFGKSLIYQLFAQWNTNKKKDLGISWIIIMKYYYQWSSRSNDRSWHFNHSITLSAAEPWGDVNILSKAIIVVLALLKAGFSNIKFSPGASNLITARRTNPTHWSSVCETVKSRSLKKNRPPAFNL